MIQTNRIHNRTMKRMLANNFDERLGRQLTIHRHQRMCLCFGVSVLPKTKCSKWYQGAMGIDIAKSRRFG